MPFSEFDRAVMLAFRHADLSPIGPAVLPSVARDITSLGSTVVLTLVTALSAIYLCMDSKRQAAYLLVATVLSGTLLNSVLKVVAARPRPDIVPHLTTMSNYSFPSGHSMMSAVTYLTLAALVARGRPPGVRRSCFLSAGLLTILVGMTRVYLGVHWPTDVLAGWLFGGIWTAVCFSIFNRSRASL